MSLNFSLPLKITLKNYNQFGLNHCLKISLSFYRFVPIIIQKSWTNFVKGLSKSTNQIQNPSKNQSKLSTRNHDTVTNELKEMYINFRTTMFKQILRFVRNLKLKF